MGIRISDLSKSFGKFGKNEVFTGLNLVIPSRKSCGILGPSGCGKSTFIRIIGGFEAPTGGTVQIDGVAVNDIPPCERGIAYMPQESVLFPSMNVWSNIAVAAPSGTLDINTLVMDAAKKANISHLFERMENLSGGELRRVGLARMILSQSLQKTSVWILDEPFKGLDAPQQVLMRHEVGEIIRKQKITMVMVTHSRADLDGVGVDYVCVMDEGQILQFDYRENVFANPADETVAGLLVY